MEEKSTIAMKVDAEKLSESITGELDDQSRWLHKVT